MRWLRRSYRAGAVVDAAAAVGMLVPTRLWTVRLAPSVGRDRSECSYGTGAGAALMGGWTLLLLWADRRPLQRMGVLPLTHAGDRRADGQRRTWPPRWAHHRSSLAPTRAVQVGLLALFGASYGLARRCKP